ARLTGESRRRVERVRARLEEQIENADAARDRRAELHARKIARRASAEPVDDGAPCGCVRGYDTRSRRRAGERARAGVARDVEKRKPHVRDSRSRRSLPVRNVLLYRVDVVVERRDRHAMVAVIVTLITSVLTAVRSPPVQLPPPSKGPAEPPFVELSAMPLPASVTDALIAKLAFAAELSTLPE